MAEEKMVPIDTSGNSVEVTLKEEDSQEIESPESDIREIIEDEVVEAKDEVVETKEVEEETSEETDPYKTDDLKDYSKGVKKRINNLVGRMREMERLYEATQQENDDLKKRYTHVGKGYVNEYEGRVTNAAEAAKSQLKKAIEDNDTEGQVAAQEALAQAKADGARLSQMKQAQQNDEKAYAPVPQQQQQQQQQYQAPAPIDTRAEEWASENEWFGSDDVMTGAAMALHNRMVSQEGFDPTSNEYYSEINSRMRTEFPHKFANGRSTEEKKTEMKQPVQTVASAVRKTKSGRRVVKLTPSQIAIAKRLNVPLQEYAKYVKE
tara:strand:+ start:20 stop:982 length:963 start_codon:yes stop_codon:yes gene_type:complete